MTSVASLTQKIPRFARGRAIYRTVYYCGLAFPVATKVDTRSVVPIASGYLGRLGTIATIASFVFIDLAQRLFGASRDLLTLRMAGGRGRPLWPHVHARQAAQLFR
jgi:hypothetical protein